MDKASEPSCSVYFYLYGSNQCNILHYIKKCSNIEKKNYIEYTSLCFFPTPSCGKIHVSCSCNHELVAVFHLTMSAFWSCFSVIVIWLSKRLNRDISWKCGNALKGSVQGSSRHQGCWNDSWLMMLEEFQHHVLAWFSTHRNLQNPATSKVSALQTATKSDGSGWKNIQIPSNLWKTGAQGRHQACFLENEKKGFAIAWLCTMQAKVKK